MKPKNMCFTVLTLIVGLVANHFLTQPAGVPPKSRTFDFTYTAEIKNLPPGSRQVSLWIPLPKADANQDISGLSVSSFSSAQPVAHRESEYGNQNFYFHVRQSEHPFLRVVMNLRVQRRELCRDVDQDLQAGLQKEPALPPARWLKPDPIGTHRWADSRASPGHHAGQDHRAGESTRNLRFCGSESQIRQDRHRLGTWRYLLRL
jgi:hypothetical protein